MDQDNSYSGSAIHPLDYYAILGLDSEASLKDIKRSYYKLALQYHPDKSKDPSSAQRFRQITEAYQILSDPSLRQEYDQGTLAEAPEYNQFKQEFAHFWRSFVNGKRDIGFSLDSIQRALGVNILPKGLQIKASLGASKPAPIRYRLNINLAEAYLAKIKPFHFKRRSVFDGESEETDAQVKVPLYVRDLEFPGEGHQDQEDGPRGDLIIELFDKPHPTYRRVRDHDLVTDGLRISDNLVGYYDIIDHDELIVFKAKVDGINFCWRLKNKGLPLAKDPSRRGDLYVLYNANKRPIETIDPREVHKLVIGQRAVPVDFLRLWDD